MANLGFDWSVHQVKLTKNDGLIAGKKIGTIHTNQMLAPGQYITVNRKKVRIRCIDLKDNNKIAIVE